MRVGPCLSPRKVCQKQVVGCQVLYEDHAPLTSDSKVYRGQALWRLPVKLLVVMRSNAAVRTFYFYGDETRSTVDSGQTLWQCKDCANHCNCKYTSAPNLTLFYVWLLGDTLGYIGAYFGGKSSHCRAHKDIHNLVSS